LTDSTSPSISTTPWTRSGGWKLRAEGYDWLAGTKFDWLRNPARFSLAAWRSFVTFVRETKLRTGRAWALKEMLMTLWQYVYPGAAERHFEA
jgi:hypothetical protein